MFGLEVLITPMKIVLVYEVRFQCRRHASDFPYKGAALVEIELRGSLRLIEELLRHLSVR